MVLQSMFLEFAPFACLTFAFSFAPHNTSDGVLKHKTKDFVLDFLLMEVSCMPEHNKSSVLIVRLILIRFCVQNKFYDLFKVGKFSCNIFKLITLFLFKKSIFRHFCLFNVMSAIVSTALSCGCKTDAICLASVFSLFF